MLIEVIIKLTLSCHDNFKLNKMTRTCHGATPYLKFDCKPEFQVDGNVHGACHVDKLSSVFVTNRSEHSD